MPPPTHEEYLIYLEQIRWGGKPCCPYCGSLRAAAYKHERRYRCNNCFTSYSVTVGTLFHRTHVDLQIWFQAIRLILNTSGSISIRQLAKELGINKNTASHMRTRIYKAMQEEPQLLQNLMEIEGFREE